MRIVFKLTSFQNFSVVEVPRNNNCILFVCQCAHERNRLLYNMLTIDVEYLRGSGYYIYIYISLAQTSFGLKIL